MASIADPDQTNSYAGVGLHCLLRPIHLTWHSCNTYVSEQMNSGESGDKIFGASGSGAISRSLRHGRTTAWSEDDLNNRIVRRVSKSMSKS